MMDRRNYGHGLKQNCCCVVQRKHWRLGEKHSTNMWENKSDEEITMVMGKRNIRDRR